MLCFPPHISSTSALLCVIGNPEDSALVHCTCNTVQLLQRYAAIDLLFPEPCPPQQSLGERIDYKISRVIQQREYESSVKKTEEIKKLVEFRQCTNTAFKGKCNFRVSPFYQVVQKHKLFDVA